MKFDPKFDRKFFTGLLKALLIGLTIGVILYFIGLNGEASLWATMGAMLPGTALFYLYMTWRKELNNSDSNIKIRN